MRHGYKKTKFADGYDADRMLIRKLATNFFRDGKVETTFTKAHAVRPLIERLVTKIKGASNADKNYLLKRLGNIDLKDKSEAIISSLGKVQSGFLRIVKLGTRDSDGAETARLEWAHPVVEVKKAQVVKKAVKKVETKKV